MGSSASKRVVPVLLVVAAAIFVYVTFQATVGGGGDKYYVYAKFDDAGGILKNYAVKVGNVDAGSVEAISLDPNDDVVVRIELDEGVGPIGAGATAHVRPVNLLGEKYVDLDPGDTSRPLPAGSTIPKQRTGIPTELDDVLNTLDPDTRAGLRILINEAGIGLAGHGADFNAVLEELPPALDEARRFVGEVAQENRALARLIVEGDEVLGAISSRRDDFAELIESAGAALDTVASRRAELGGTVRSAPGALEQLTSTLARLEVTADQLTPAARDLRAAIPGLAATLAEAPGFAGTATSALTAVREASPALERLGRRSVPTLERLQPTARRLDRFAGRLRPLLDAADRGKGLREFLDFMDGWVGVIENADGLGHVFRLRLTFDEQFFTSGIQKYVDALNGPSSGGGSSQLAGNDNQNSTSDDNSQTEGGGGDPDDPVDPLLDTVGGLTQAAQQDAADILGPSHGPAGSHVSGEVDELLDFLIGQ